MVEIVMEIRTLERVSDWMMRLVLSRRSFRFTPNQEENELSETMDQPRNFIGFVPARNLNYRDVRIPDFRRSTCDSPFCSS